MDPSSEKPTSSTLFLLFGFVNVVYPRLSFFREHECWWWLTNGCMATHFSGKAQVRRLSVSVFRPGEAVESSAATMARWPKKTTEIDWDGLHLTTSYNTKIQLGSYNLQWNASKKSQVFFSAPRPVVWRSLVCGGARRISWEWWTDLMMEIEFFGDDTAITMKFTIKSL